ncbi:MAG: NAD(P) transhydrogenase subunit alpha [Candidatus Marinimicrobia bacterium]|nr:NAD(P) transhydrogenase subunit alpha [Candidatus Neomarinimicrobiota bacterium]
MQIYVGREPGADERRVALLPGGVKQLSALGFEVICEPGLGAAVNVADEEYTAAGARLAAAAGALAAADVVLKVRPPGPAWLENLKPGCLLISYLDPFFQPRLIAAAAARQIAAFCMEMIPRTTLAQKMDALSSQASLAGYVAVMLAANRLDQVLPMMMTPAGTLAPARVFVIGAGVAGLQAIATARRLGARVEAFDTRPVVEEQVQSLGARFVKVDLGETGQTKDGYAKALTPEQLEIQRQAMARHCAQADVVITTAALFGRKAPLIVTDAMLAGMKPGSVVVDLAVETGGNVEGVVPDQETVIHGVRVLGWRNLPGRVPLHASQMYSSNLVNLLTHLWDAPAKAWRDLAEDEIWRAGLLTRDGEIVQDAVRESVQAGLAGAEG